MDQIYTTALPPFPEWDGLQLEYPPEVSHPRDQIEKMSLNPALPPAPGHTGNAGDVAVQAFPAPLPSIGQTPENNWTEAETAVFGRADPADDEWTDEESNQTGVGSRSKHKSARRWIYTDSRSPSLGAVEKIPEFPKDELDNSLSPTEVGLAH
ncbi:hypothetical protein B0H14DRAFT_2574562 [Mycena olivaceomarginata]|nr:hypothetical protein B0H14DRAFT_2574562 [Mycena olivaceomarginata]